MRRTQDETSSANPLFQIFDHQLAKSFYGEWLGFSIDCEHQFTPTAPRYIQISRDSAILHLTEHNA
jgi:glyoxalase superfamily protein